MSHSEENRSSCYNNLLFFISQGIQLYKQNIVRKSFGILNYFSFMLFGCFYDFKKSKWVFIYWILVISVGCTVISMLL